MLSILIMDIINIINFSECSKWQYQCNYNTNPELRVIYKTVLM